MSISRITAYIVAHDEVKCEAYRDGKKYGGIISRMENGNYRMLLSSEPTYDSEEEAVKAMEEVVANIKKYVAEETSKE